MTKYYELLADAAKISPYHPATDPPTWYQLLDREAVYDIYRGKPLSPDAPKSVGGFYPVVWAALIAFAGIWREILQLIRLSFPFF
jgi:hypothetical protein